LPVRKPVPRLKLVAVLRLQPVNVNSLRLRPVRRRLVLRQWLPRIRKPARRLSDVFVMLRRGVLLPSVRLRVCL
jgi:hypothetical protein